MSDELHLSPEEEKRIEDAFGTPIGPIGGWGPIEPGQDLFANWPEDLELWPTEDDWGDYEIPEKEKSDPAYARAFKVALASRETLCRKYCANRHLLETKPAAVARIVLEIIVHSITHVPAAVEISIFIVQRGILDVICKCDGHKDS